MKKLICCLLAVLLLASLCACGKLADADTNTPTPTPDAAPSATPQPTPGAEPDADEQTPAPSNAPVTEPDGNAPEDTQPIADIDLTAFVGDWHEAIAGRGMMKVSLVDGNPYFEVRWPDSAFAYYEFTFLAIPDGTGRLRYEGGFKGRTEYVLDSEDDGEVKTTVDDTASGTVELTESGSILWTEDTQPDNPHEFVPDEPIADIDLTAFVGDWHDAIAGRGTMKVSLVDGNPYFEVRWPDSAFAYYEFTFLAIPDGTGRLRYEGGFKGRTEYVLDSEDDGEVKTTVDDTASGTVELTENGSILWTEDTQPDNPHEFVKD